MANFNTNQTRHFYVAKDIKSNVEGLSAAGDIALLEIGAGIDKKFCFAYKNADGLITRSDLINPSCISHLKASLYDFANSKNPMDIELMAHTVTLDTAVFNPANADSRRAFDGKSLNLMVTIHQMLSYDESDSYSFVASVVLDSSINTVALFHKALALAIAKAMPQNAGFKVFSNGAEVTAKSKAADVQGSAAGVILVPAAQKWIRGKKANEPVSLSVAFSFHGGSNIEVLQWGNDAIAPSQIAGNKVIPAAYALADLEYFALGERGDFERGNIYNFEPTYMINPADASTIYNVLNIEFYWAGAAEDVQKSPRMIQVAAPANSNSANDIVSKLYNAVVALQEPLASRVAALEANA